jgi:hypothetical protein
MSIVKSAQLPNVGRCGGGLPMATFERLEPYVGKPTSTVLMGLGSGNGLWLPDRFYQYREFSDSIKSGLKLRVRGGDLSRKFFCPQGLTKLWHCLIYTNDSSQRYKFRLNTSLAIKALLRPFAGCNRFLWNKSLALQKERLYNNQRCLSYSRLCNLLHS